MSKKSNSPRIMVIVNENGFVVGSQKRGPIPKAQATTKPLSSKPCPVCGKLIREDRLAAHRKNAHFMEKTDLPSFIQAKQEVSSNSQTSKSSSQVNQPLPQRQKSTSTTSSGQVLIPCTYCNAPIAPQNMAWHLRKVHRLKSPVPQSVPSPKKKPAKPAAIRLPGTSAHHVRCSECKQSVHQDRLQAHMRKVHGIWVKRNEKNRYRTVTGRTRSHSSRTSSQDRLSRQQLEQSSDEPFDGGKYLGHIKRENGPFGTLPLYDDYGDESSP